MKDGGGQVSVVVRSVPPTARLSSFTQILATFLAAMFVFAAPALASPPPGPPVGLPPMHHAQITNAMGTAAVTILAGCPSCGANSGNDITICASGCTFTSSPSGAVVPAVFYMVSNGCGSAQSGSITVYDGSAQTEDLMGPLTLGVTQWVTAGWGGALLVATSGLTVVMSAAENASCVITVWFN
jgi:hypothetical protein